MKNRLYDATKIDWDNLMFSTKELWMLLIPIMVEQMLNSLMGMADTMMVSNVGSVAMSAVSLVDSINTLVIQVFAALATGAAIICSHYLGKGDEKGANKAARQIFLTVIVISLTITAGGGPDLLQTSVTPDFWSCGACGYGGFRYIFPDHGIFLSVYCPV